MKKTIIIGLLACCVLLLPDKVTAQRYLPRMGGITVNGGVTEKPGFYKLVIDTSCNKFQIKTINVHLRVELISTFY